MPTCESCRHENAPGARFCQHCGVRLVSGCPGCGASLAAGARFCSQCGHALADEQPRAARSYTPRHLADRILTTTERARVSVMRGAGSDREPAQTDFAAARAIFTRFGALAE